VYDTLLSAPGMNESVKVDLRVNRKQVLLLVQLIEKGLIQQGEGLADLASPDDQDSIRLLVESLLEKAGHADTNRHLKLLVK
jgi:hypothetical protein